ncbi:hypothetical protein H4R27_002537 [Coemansia aciculifera]|nr:hypothetical protein H4R27_002537 [Coemansia aciculifera]
MIDGVRTLCSDPGSPDVLALASGRDGSKTCLPNYMARLVATTHDVIPRRVTLYSAAFGVGHVDSGSESDSDIAIVKGDTQMDVDQVVAPISTNVAKDASPEPMYIIVNDSSPSEPEQFLSPTANARKSLERLSLRSPPPQQILRESNQESDQLSPEPLSNHFFPEQPPEPLPESLPEQFPEHLPEQLVEASPEQLAEPLPEQTPSPAQKRRIAPCLITSELPAVSTGNLVAEQQPFVLIPPPTLAPLEARQQLRSAFEKSRFSQFKPFRTFTRRHLVKRPAENPDRVLPPAISSSGESLVPKFIKNVGDSFWFCRHASFTQDHIIAQLQAEDDSQQQQRATLDDDMVTVQSWMWRHLRHNDRLLVDDFEEDEETLPVYGESDDEGEYSDSLIREISEEQREASERRARLDTVERERIAEVQRIMQQRLALFYSEWQAKQQPRLELRACSLWRSNVAGRIRLETNLAKLVDERLPKIQRAVIDSGEARKSKIISLCENLRVTADQISEIKWLLELTSGPQPLPLRSHHARKQNMDQAPDHGPRRNTRKLIRPQKRVAQRYYSARASATLPGLSSRLNHPGHLARPANGGSDGDDDDITMDSMDDFIDDNDDVGSAKNLSSTGLSTANGRLISSAPTLEATVFATELARHSPDAMYSAAISYIQQMARGVTSFSTASISSSVSSLSPDTTSRASSLRASGLEPTRAVSAGIALRVWAEFQHWIHTARPTVRVQYASFPIRDKAKMQLDHLLAKQQAGTNVEISIKPPQRWVPKRFADVAASVVATPLLHMRAKDRPLRPPTSADIAPRSSASLVIDGRYLPEVLHVMHDNGVAQHTAFSDFYHWRRHNDGAHRSPTMPSSEEDIDKSTDAKKTGHKKSRNTHKRPYDALISSDDDGSARNGNFAVDTAILEAEAEHAEQAVLSSQSKTPATPVTPARNRRRNIRPIREEDAEVLETRRIQRQAEEEINRRMQKAAAAAATESSANNSQGAFSQQTSVIVPIDDDDDDDNDGEVVVSGTRPAVVASAEPATIEIDIGKIGTPTLINPGHFDDQSDVAIPGFIAAHLKPHQLEGVRFMWRNLVMLSNHCSSMGDRGSTSTGRLIPPQHGCVLAHSMGLGKTLQTIALIYTLLNAVSAPTPIPDFVGSNYNTRRVLILCPPTIQANWAAEFWKWAGVHHTTANTTAYHRAVDGPLLPPGYGDNDNSSGAGGIDHRTKLRILQALRRETRRVVTQVVNLGQMQNMKMRLAALGAWHQYGGVMIMGYPGFRELMKVVEGRLSKRATAAAPAASGRDSSSSPGPADSDSPQILLRRYLLDEGPCLVVADEGHVIKNSDALLSKYVNLLKTKARVCLTGYPLQNNLVEYWTMVNFCSSKFLGDLPDFRNNYVHPIDNGLYLDSSPADKRMSTLRMKALHGLLEGIVDRRDMSVLHSQLPRKAEYVIACPLTPAQMHLYSAYLAHVVGIGPDSEDSSVVQAASGQNLLVHSSALSSICNHPAIFHSVVTSDSSSPTTAAAGRARAAQAQAMSLSIDNSADLEQLEELAQELDSSGGGGSLGGRNTDWCKDIFASYSEPGQDLRLPSHCLKVMLMLDIIRLSIAQGERVLVFTRSIPTLDYLQQAVDASGILAATSGSSLRIDGSTNIAYRQDLIDSFNAPNSPHYLFFISSGTGSIGVNLVAASRVIIFDVGWNPLYDEQAIARAYRYGQRRRVYVYRLITAGTWEDNLFSNNLFKVAMTRRVVDRQTTGRRNTRDEMRRYFQHPPLISPTISTDDVARLAEEYHDDSVFTTLLTDHASNLAKVTPQATLVAEEEEHLLEGDSEVIKLMINAEMQRFGQIPVTNSPQTDASASTPVSALTAANRAASAAINLSRPRTVRPPVPPPPLPRAATPATATSTNMIDASHPLWYDIRRQKVAVVKDLLGMILKRLAAMPDFPPEQDIANRTRVNLISIFNTWQNAILAYINEAGADLGRRYGEILVNALLGLCSNVFCKNVVHLHLCTDEGLRQHILNAATGL